MADFTEQRFDYSAGRKDAPELVIMVGISGSGKSVLAKGWVNGGRGSIVRLNRDSLRAMLYADVPWSGKLENLVRNLEKEAARMTLQTDRDCIVDDTNCVRQTRYGWETFAKENNVRFRVVRMTTPIEVCIERDSKREGKEQVGEGVIRKQFKDLNEVLDYESPDTRLSPINQATTDRDSFRTGEFTRRLAAPFVLCDVDGTLADHGGVRSPFDESRVLFDGVYTAIADEVRSLYSQYNIIIVSGRHAGCCEDTIAWLQRCRIPFDFIVMRSDGDNRSDAVIKPELLGEILTTVRINEVVYVIDDRPRVIQAWKALGLRVRPVYMGSFIDPVAWTIEHSSTCTYSGPKGYRRCPDCGALEDF